MSPSEAKQASEAMPAQQLATCGPILEHVVNLISDPKVW
jgi:hypothetical protein